MAKIIFALIGTLLILPTVIGVLCKLAALNENSWKLSKATSLMRKASLSSLPLRNIPRLHTLADDLNWHAASGNNTLQRPQVVLNLNKWERLSDDEIKKLDNDAICRQLSRIDDLKTHINTADVLLKAEGGVDEQTDAARKFLALYSAFSWRELPGKDSAHLMRTIQLFEKQRGYQLNENEIKFLTDIYRNLNITSSHESVIRIYHLIRQYEWQSILSYKHSYVNSDTIKVNCQPGLLSAPKKVTHSQEDQNNINRIEISQLNEIADSLDLTFLEKIKLRRWLQDVNHPNGCYERVACKQHLKEIIYKFQDPAVSSDDKRLSIKAILDKIGACKPSWVQAARSEMVKLYTGGGVENQLLQYIQEIKDEIILGMQRGEWHVLSNVRSRFGNILGLDTRAGIQDRYNRIGQVNPEDLVRHFNKHFTLKHLIPALLEKIKKDNTGENRSEIQIILANCAYSHYKDNMTQEEELKEEVLSEDDFEVGEAIYIENTFFDKRDGQAPQLNAEGLIYLLIETGLLKLPAGENNPSTSASNASLFGRIKSACSRVWRS